MGRRRRPKEKRGQPRIKPKLDRMFRDMAIRETIPRCVKYARASLLEHYRRGGLKLAEEQYRQLIAEMPLLKFNWALAGADEKAILDNLKSLMKQLRKKATRHLNN